MKKIISCGLLLAMLGSVGTMCFAMNDTSSICDKAVSELEKVADLRDEYMVTAIKFWNDSANTAKEDAFNSVLNKVTDSYDTLEKLAINDNLDLGQRAILNLYQISIDPYVRSVRCSQIDWDRVYQQLPISGALEEIKDNYKDICYSYPTWIWKIGQISQLNYEQAALTLVLMQDNFNRVDGEIKRLTEEALRLSDSSTSSSGVLTYERSDDNILDVGTPSLASLPTGTSEARDWHEFASDGDKC